MKKTAGVLSSVLGVYLVFVLVTALVPYALPKEVSPKYKEEFEERDFAPNPDSTDRAALVEEPNDAFMQRLNLIRNAEERIDFVCHSIHRGRTSDYFFAELLSAADRGVQVRVLLDAKAGGTFSGERKDIALTLANHPNIEYKVFNRINFLKPWQWNTLLHDKFLIVDNKLVLAGGRNIGDSYFLPPNHDGTVTYDRDVLVYNTAHPNVEQSIIGDMEFYYDLLWYNKESVDPIGKLSARQLKKAENKKQELYDFHKQFNEDYPQYLETLTLEEIHEHTVATKGVHLLVNPINTVKKEPWIGYDLTQLAFSAKESVVVHTPYATANKHLLNVFSQIGDKDVSFDMLTNSLASSPNFPAFSNYITQRQKFVDTGVTIHEYQADDHSIHSKSYLFDDNISVVGSYNLDDRSMFIDTETMLMINSKEFNKILSNTIDEKMDMSLIVSEDNKYIDNPNLPPAEITTGKRLIMWLASIISRLFQFII